MSTCCAMRRSDRFDQLLISQDFEHLLRIAMPRGSGASLLVLGVTAWELGN